MIIDNTIESINESQEQNTNKNDSLVNQDDQIIAPKKPKSKLF